MNLSPNAIVAIALGYAAVLFAVAFLADWRMRRGRWKWLNSPLVYTLSISVYCTSWTFYGAVGSAARSGLEFATIYLGPTIVFVGWWVFMRKLVRIAQRESSTSIADFISSRYGKSQPLAALVTLIAVVATLPYIALQLKAVAMSFHLIIEAEAGQAVETFAAQRVDDAIFRTAFWLAVGMAVFTILFGARNVDVRERHHGLVAAIALEGLVKLAALIAVGLFAIWVVGDGPTSLLDGATPEMLHSENAFGARWAALTFLAAVAVICLPRQFHVTVVECVNEDHGRTAAWAFPLYLFLISLFVLPIAIAGLAVLPATANPDQFVLTLPLSYDADALALFAFLGGFSSATSMVIVACIALSTMVSNHILTPLAMRTMPELRSGTPTAGDVRRFLLGSRRLSICLILGLGFLYFRMSGESEALASIGLIAFVGVAQLLPSIVAAMYWPRATSRGASAGMIAGFSLWLLLLFAPSFNTAEAPLQGVLASVVAIADSFAIEGFDALVSALFWSLSVNVIFLVVGSLTRAPTPLERVQSAQFVDVFRGASEQTTRAIRRSAGSADLFVVAQRILGAEAALRLFEEERARQGRATGLPVADDAFIERLERRLAGSVGAASARAMVSSVTTGETVSLQELIGIADEAARLVDYSHRLEQKSQELERIAAQLRGANEQLKRLDAQKDAFLSQISHELRTPMTSLRAFAQILQDAPDLSGAEAQRFLAIIDEESLRLTRLLDQILDLSQLEQGGFRLKLGPIDPDRELDRAIETCAPIQGARPITFDRTPPSEPIRLRADADRLRQVFLNVLTNAIKYNTSPEPWIWVETARRGDMFEVVISDNGPGVSEADREFIFSQFARGEGADDAPGAGLGLAICRQIMERHGGGIDLVSGPSEGAKFRIRLPITAPARVELEPADAT